MIQKNLKMTETLAQGYSSESTQRELSCEYQHDRVLDFFQKKTLRSCALDISKSLSIGRVNHFMFRYLELASWFGNCLIDNTLEQIYLRKNFSQWHTTDISFYLNLNEFWKFSISNMLFAFVKLTPCCLCINKIISTVKAQTCFYYWIRSIGLKELEERLDFLSLNIGLDESLLNGDLPLG